MSTPSGGSVLITPINECAEWILRVTCEGDEGVRESHSSFEAAALSASAWMKRLGFKNLGPKSFRYALAYDIHAGPSSGRRYCVSGGGNGLNGNGTGKAWTTTDRTKARTWATREEAEAALGDFAGWIVATLVIAPIELEAAQAVAA